MASESLVTHVGRAPDLYRVLRPSIDASANKPAGHRAGVLAALKDRSPGDERGLIPVDTLHEAAAARRHVVDQLGLVEPQAIEVDQVHIGAQSDRLSASVM